MSYETPEVVNDSGGKACQTTNATSDYGDYPVARCNLWKSADGLLSDETIRKGIARITCQRDLERDNPIYTPGQTNTWWVWTTSENGTWDWFPETAVAEGVSDQPINGIALCDDAA